MYITVSIKTFLVSTDLMSQYFTSTTKTRQAYDTKLTSDLALKILFVRPFYPTNFFNYKFNIFGFPTAATGGLLGLGLGLSFISVFELLYFLCLRWFFPKIKSKSRSRDESVDCNTLPPGNKWASTTTVGTNISIS